ncbi:D-fructose 1,6-bisphosphatase [Pseudooceanicola nitratireducens]|jgi:fructose-1,6-bisphosphatase I|uniref:Fructose-1,6-bisphosphatase class 1 n=1 Tax=Pseudooceanicola nitratireducens TaxID=517719 RepID=A0A1I1I034_9RHOB|nr:class 1 fructose-bisphosphatase [Pseudooceanicola nitratireducens]SEJ17508.1 fructose-1,6-bisphosphatase I [Pseudooceanicola nitratireducens]SFC29687.1 D-fructose 1,6-bisphosphatase [Pseudooceanicola nitratireducens]
MTTIDPARIPENLRPVIEAMCATGAQLSRVIARGPLAGKLGAGVGENSDGDQQKALDVMADEMFEAALRGTGVKYYASEEQEDVLTLDEGGTFALATDPLDGSSNIDVNVTIGTIFSIFPVADSATASFLRPARDQICAGYIAYGPQTLLAVTFGAGTVLFVLDPETGRFELAEEKMDLPVAAKEFSINASNRRHWGQAVLAYVEENERGKDGPKGKDMNFRWVGSLVAETHRILTRGGTFLYPSDSRKGYENGRLRMVYEVAPMAYLVEQAGGKATDGVTPIMDLTAEQLHERRPFVFGSAEEVDRITALHC